LLGEDNVAAPLATEGTLSQEFVCHQATRRIALGENVCCIIIYDLSRCALGKKGLEKNSRTHVQDINAARGTGTRHGMQALCLMDQGRVSPHSTLGKYLEEMEPPGKYPSALTHELLLDLDVFPGIVAVFMIVTLVFSRGEADRKLSAALRHQMPIYSAYLWASALEGSECNLLFRNASLGSQKGRNPAIGVHKTTPVVMATRRKKKEEREE